MIFLIFKCLRVIRYEFTRVTSNEKLRCSIRFALNLSLATRLMLNEFRKRGTRLEKWIFMKNAQELYINPYKTKKYSFFYRFLLKKSCGQMHFSTLKDLPNSWVCVFINIRTCSLTRDSINVKRVSKTRDSFRKMNRINS